MQYTCKQTLLLDLIVLCAAFVLVVVTPKDAAADDHSPGGKQSSEVSWVCREHYRPAWASWPGRTELLAKGDSAPESLTVRMLEEGVVELQMPATLLKALQRVRSERTTVELQVPAALLMLLQTEGCGEIPYRSITAFSLCPQIR
jgi:hypothetical protein